MDLDFDAMAFAARCADIGAVAFGSESTLAAQRERRLQALLESARDNSRLLRSLWGRQTGFAELPPLKKAELMADFDDWVTDPQLRLAELQGFLADPAQIGHSYREKFVVWQSSGSGGEPAVFVQDRAAMAVYDALEALRSPSAATRRRGFGPWLLGERAALVVATEGHFASSVSLQRMRRLNPWWRDAMQAFSVMQPLPALVQALNRYAPTTLATYPTAAAILADAALDGTLTIRPRELRTGGETLTPAMRRHIATAFGCPVIDSYGASEFLCIAFECGEGRLHANTDWVLLEPVDEQYRPLPPGTPSYTTLLTNLANHVQPLVRVDIGDGLCMHRERCACGSPLPVIEVQGRCDDTLHVAGRDGVPVALLPLALVTVLEDDAALFHFELQQRTANTLVLRVPEGDAAATAHARRAAKVLHEWAVAQGAQPSLRVQVQAGAALPPGHSGKRRRVQAAASTRA